ncbi:MAG: 60S ribosomal export protein NMD3 [Desulfurococcales archaeon]|nr:60S ribosomal export protein NMD3 [Desulfurococcales archaeon]
MARARICPSCGRTTEIVISGLCPDCYAQRQPIARGLPGEVEVAICRFCGSVRIRGRWLPSASFDEAVARVVESLSLKPASPIEDVGIAGWRFETLPDWRTRVMLTLEGKVESVRVKSEVIVTVRLKPVTCPRCAVKRSGEYDTLVQVRGEGALKDVVERALEDLEEWDSLIEVIEAPEGVDVYFMHRGAASRFLKALARHAMIESIGKLEHEIVGVSSRGRVRSRKTIVVRLKGEREA